MQDQVTITIQIGNTDNKLTQNEWAHFCAEMKKDIESIVTEVHFCGGSDWDAPWQNACWVVAVEQEDVRELVKAVKSTRQCYQQDSVAMTYGVTEFV